MILNYNNILNIKELPKIEQITPGNSLIIFKSDKPYLLDYDNFIITESNTSYYVTMENNITSIDLLSSNVIDLSSTVVYDSLSGTLFQSVSTSLNTSITGLTSNFYNAVDTMTATLISELESVSSYTPYLPRGWVTFDDMANITRKAGVINTVTGTTSLFTVTFDPPFIDTNYFAIVTPNMPITTLSDDFSFIKINSKNRSSMTIAPVLTSNNPAITVCSINVAVYCMY